MDPAVKPLQWEDVKSLLSTDMIDALSNNKPPADAALNTVAAIRKDPESSIVASANRKKCIDREIRKLSEERRKLSNEANVRAAVCNACDIVSAPIRRVPLDVIREIAHFALDDHPSASFKSSPMTLGRVCSAWRSAVLSSPTLWSTLYLTVKTVEQDSIIESVRTVQNWFRRASGAPKKFFLYVDCPIPSGTPSYNFQLFLKAIGPSLSGLTYLAIGSRNWAHLMVQFVDIEWNVSNLERLEFLGQLSSAGQDHKFAEEMTKLASVVERITLFKEAKLLTAMVSAQEMRAFRPSFAFLPWNQFTDISIQESFHHQTSLIDTLRRLPQLGRACLTCKNLLHTEGATGLVHENLRSLTLLIAKSGAHECLGFFSNCIFPKLKNLKLSITNMKTAQLNNQMFTINSFPSLEILNLTDDIRIPTNLLICLLRGTPKLRLLSMHICDRDGRSTDLNQIFSTMTIKDGHCGLLPCLTRFLFFGVADAPGIKFLLDASVVSRCINSRFADLPEGCWPLQQAIFGGRFRFLVNLEDEVAHLSQGRDLVHIWVSNADDILEFATCDALGFQIPFSIGYAENHEHQVIL